MSKHCDNQKIYTKGIKKHEYDVIIIGAGIGGLTCGCYLVQAGMKVLIIEQHFKPGGYCTSFKRKGFTFDATTHYIGSFRENGLLKNIYDELELNSKVNIIRFDPSNVVISPEHRIHIRSNIKETISEFQECFKDEAKNIKKFFDFIWNSEFTSLYIKLKNKTFKDVLNEYFKDNKLKSMLGCFLGNIGLPPSKASALAVAVLYREFVLDGGYYPEGGMQKFSDAFAEIFIEGGGEIQFNRRVDKIVIDNHNVKGVSIDNETFMKSDIVVSNGDVMNTFFKLIDNKDLPLDFVNRINNLETSPSAFIVYLGLDKSYANMFSDRSSWWCSLSDCMDMEKMFSDLNRQDKPYIGDSFLCFFPSSHDSSLTTNDGEIVILFTPAKMTYDNFWHENKNSVADELINKAEQFVPGLSDSVVVKEMATPLTLNRYTSNMNGACYGWAPTSLQTEKDLMPSTTFIKGLYLAGHWATLKIGPGGIATVAFCGKKVAHIIMKNFN